MHRKQQDKKVKGDVQGSLDNSKDCGGLAFQSDFN